MRKYFLISAVALLAATNVNANNYSVGSFETSATIEYANKVSCTNIDFGRIVITEPDDFHISADPETGGISYQSPNIIEIENSHPFAECSLSHFLTIDDGNFQIEFAGEGLQHEDGDYDYNLSMTPSYYKNCDLDSCTLYLGADISGYPLAGKYTGITTFQIIY